MLQRFLWRTCAPVKHVVEQLKEVFVVMGSPTDAFALVCDALSCDYRPNYSWADQKVEGVQCALAASLERILTMNWTLVTSLPKGCDVRPLLFETLGHSERDVVSSLLQVLSSLCDHLGPLRRPREIPLTGGAQLGGLACVWAEFALMRFEVA